MEHSWKNKRVLVTGADGFIGAALTRRLLKEGADVTALVGPHGSRMRLGADAERMHIFPVDLADREAAVRLVAESAPEVVFNAASSTNATRDFALIDTVLHGTYDISRAVIDAAVAAKVARFVQFGTIEEYGTAATPYQESMREEPVSPYSLGKVMATHYALLAGALTGMHVTIVRPATTYGPGQGPGMLIPNLIRAGLAGTDFPMHDGMQARDFIYVDDLVDGVLRAGSAEGATGQICNLGSNRTHMVRSLVEEIMSIMGNPVTVNFGAMPPRPLERAEVFMDSSKAKELLGWQATTSLTDGMKKTVAWYQAHPDFFSAQM